MEAGVGLGLASALGVFAFFGGIARIVLVSSKSEVQKRQLEHAERIKALELGRPLPDADIAWASADRGRAVAAGFIGTLVPLALVGSALAGTAIVFSYTSDSTWRVVLTAIIWGVCGLVSLVTVVSALGTLARRRAGVKPEEAAAKGSPITGSSEAIQEHAATL